LIHCCRDKTICTNMYKHTSTTLPSSIQWMRLASESSDRHSRLNSSHDLVHSFENVFRHSRLHVGFCALEQQCNLAESIPMRSMRDTSTVVGSEADSEPWRKHCHSLSCKLQWYWRLWLVTVWNHTQILKTEISKCKFSKYIQT